MKENFKTLAVIFSVILNGVFIGSYFYYGSGLAGFSGRLAEHKHPLYELLDLDRKQLDKFKFKRKKFHTFVNRQGRKIKARQLELVDLLDKEKPNHPAIDAKQEEIQALQRQMQAKVIDHLLEESRTFSPEQRQKFFALIKGSIEKSDGPRPRWMPKTQANPLTVEHP